MWRAALAGSETRDAQHAVDHKALCSAASYKARLQSCDGALPTAIDVSLAN
jgi:hypothetical protein